MTDLFGRPIYDTPRAVQPALFGARHWFTQGYLDCWRGNGRDYTACTDYHVGFDAGRGDMRQDDRDSNCDADRAFRQARAVGNVSEG